MKKKKIDNGGFFPEGRHKDGGSSDDDIPLNVEEDDCKLLYGDCIEILREFEEQSVDVVITDPPYNVGIDYGEHKDADEEEAYKKWCTDWLSLCLRVSRGPVCFTPGTVNLKMWYSIDPPPKWMMCWYKPFARSRSPVGCNNWEPILFYGKPFKKNGSDVIKAIVEPEWIAGKHPCPKPLIWARELIELLTDEKQIVLDPFMGSATVGVASYQLRRKFIGIEKDDVFFEMARRRLHYGNLPESQKKPPRIKRNKR